MRPREVAEDFETIGERTTCSNGKRVIPGIGDTEAGVEARKLLTGTVESRPPIGRQIYRDRNGLCNVVAPILNQVGRHPMWGLADKFCIQKDGEPHSACTDIADLQRKLAGQRLLEAQ